MNKPIAKYMFRCALATLWLTGAAMPAVATIPVIDFSALAQLAKQVSAWQQQLSAMQQQLQQLQTTNGAITGNRGLGELLPISAADRNYLPLDWTGLQALYEGTSTSHQSLQTMANEIKQTNTILQATDLARLPQTVHSLLAVERGGIAGNQALMRHAYANQSARFADLQTLVTAIGTTTDLKAINELNARIGAERAMLLNESIKIASLAHIASTDSAARELQRRELVMIGHGSFATRFQPVAPIP